MKYFIKFDNSSFTISNSIVNALTSNNFNFKKEVHNKSIELVMNDFDIPFLQIVETTSVKNYYVLILNRKYRISKQLYTFLNSLKTKVNKNPKQLGQFFTEQPDYILQGLTMPDCVKIIEPFAGNGDLIA